MKALGHNSGGFHVACLDLTVAEGKNLQKGHGFLGLLVACDVLDDGLGLPVLGDDERLAVLAQGSDDLSGVSFEVADRFDLIGEGRGAPP